MNCQTQAYTQQDGARMVFTLACSNFLLGAIISLGEQNSGLEQPVLILPTRVTNPDFTIALIREIPAGYSTELVYCVDWDGLQPPEGWSMKLQISEF